jgi:hypothetical protein
MLHFFNFRILVFHPKSSIKNNWNSHHILFVKKSFQNYVFNLAATLYDRRSIKHSIL